MRRFSLRDIFVQLNRIITMKVLLNFVVLFVLQVRAANINRNPQYGQSLQQDIQTSIIDIPDEQPTLSSNSPQSDLSGWTYPWFPQQVTYPSPRTTSGTSYHSKPVDSQIYPYQYPYHYNGINQNPYAQYYNSPFTPYTPYFPKQYVRNYYPSLYRYFPNGFYILPVSENRQVEPKTTKDTIQEEVFAPTTENNVGNTESYAQVKQIPVQTATIQITNHTNYVEKKSFVNRVELEPVSMKFTRYSGNDGKTYVKITSSDSDGNEAVTESVYTGEINLRIKNGVVQPPSESSTEASNYNENEDLYNREQVQTESNVEESTQPENAEPEGILSWLNSK